MTIYAVRAQRVLQYDGTNSAALLAVLNEQKQLTAQVLAETPEKLTMRLVSYGGPSQGGADDVVEIAPTDWARPTSDWVEVIPAEVFDSQWIRVQA